MSDSVETCWTLNVPDARCCTSCHEDVDYDYPLGDYTLLDGREAYICCGATHWLREAGLLA